VCAVHIEEAFGLLSTLTWVHELNVGPVDFELNSKKVVDRFHASTHDIARVFFPNFIITLVLSLLGDKQMSLLIV
jgi:hypothetical protein